MRNAKRLKVQTISAGQHPSERLVVVATADGKTEELVVDRRSIEDDTLKIGYPIGTRAGGEVLVELPRETLSGTWRIWVRQSDLKEVAA